MISCEEAVQSYNLHYSMIKFVAFHGLVWSGSNLPLKMSALGDLVLCEIDLRDRSSGQRQPATWERGMLHADFNSQTRYDLKFRLEYRAPFTTDAFGCDFESIHPNRYRLHLDFGLGNLAGAQDSIRVQHGPRQVDLSLADSMRFQFEEGATVQLTRTMEAVSIAVADERIAPFAHGAFPVLSVVNAKARAVGV